VALYPFTDLWFAIDTLIYNTCQVEPYSPLNYQYTDASPTCTIVNCPTTPELPPGEVIETVTTCTACCASTPQCASFQQAIGYANTIATIDYSLVYYSAYLHGGLTQIPYLSQFITASNFATYQYHLLSFYQGLFFYQNELGAPVNTQGLDPFSNLFTEWTTAAIQWNSVASQSTSSTVQQTATQTATTLQQNIWQNIASYTATSTSNYPTASQLNQSFIDTFVQGSNPGISIPSISP